ncbi:MAG: ATP-binding protein [Gemmatimonadota bacterium]
MIEARGRPAHSRLESLDRLRLRLTAWYVGTSVTIVLALGTGLFLAVARQIGRELDRTLDTATSQLIVAAQLANGGPLVQRLRMPGMMLYVLDSAARPIVPDTASELIRSLARVAAVEGAASDERPTVKEHQLRMRARAFRSETGPLRIAVAAADLEDLEDRYGELITLFVLAAVLALGFVAIGGVLLARKSAQPVEAAVEHMRQFMADAAHELRTPVTVVRTEAEIALERARDPEEDARAFRRVALESVRLSSVVDDLFTLARADSAELPVEHSIVFLDDVVSDALAAISRRAADKQIPLTLEHYEEAPVRGSSTLLARLVIILLDNAVKYTPDGGRITVAVRADQNRVTLEVNDTGVGIAPDALPRVFDRFFRSDDARATTQGAGLGLAIAQWIAHAHDGELTLASSPLQGTTARLEIPRSEASG